MTTCRLRVVATLLTIAWVCTALGISCRPAEQVSGPVTGLPPYRPRVAAEPRRPVAQWEADTLQLSFAGDIMAHRVNFETTPFSSIYAGVAEILQGDDASFANLEFTVDPQRPYSTYPRFNVHPDYVAAAIAGGFDIFSLANNHSTDFGRESIAQTRAGLRRLAESHGVSSAGLKERPGDPIGLETIDVAGWSVGFIAVTLFVNDPGRGLELVDHVDLRSAESRQTLLDVVARAAGEHDVVAVSVHGGVEYALDAHPDKAAFYHEIAAAGATVVWGHHPHVLQPWAYHPRDDGGTSLVLYSTGNFISGQIHYLGADDARRRRAFTGDSAIFQVTIARDGEARAGARDGGATATVVRVEPRYIANVREPGGGFVVFPFDALPPLEPEWRDYYAERRRLMVRELDRAHRRVDARRGALRRSTAPF
ncbi:MAG: CapA family protein [bacterium]